MKKFTLNLLIKARMEQSFSSDHIQQTFWTEEETKRPTSRRIPDFLTIFSSLTDDCADSDRFLRRRLAGAPSPTNGRSPSNPTSTTRESGRGRDFSDLGARSTRAASK